MIFSTAPSVSATRRTWLTAAVLAVPWLQACGHGQVRQGDLQALQTLEKNAAGRLGAALVDHRGSPLFTYRAEERFPACSTFKALLAALVLDLEANRPGLLQQRVRYARTDLTTYAPVTGRFVEIGMTVAELCDATVRYSDNVAANLLMREFGGPQALTAFARRLGDTTFRLDRWEPDLNTAIPGDPRDTCTPLDMARNLRHLVLGDGLPATGRAQMARWLVGNTTGDKRIRAGVPAGWTVGDKTGTGDYGSTNDIAVLWPSQGEPMVLAVYFTQFGADAKARDDVLAETTRRALDAASLGR